MIPTNYSSYTRGSFWRTVILTTVCTLFLHAFLNAQDTCTVKTGSLTSEICIQNQQVTLRATSRGDTVIPAGYQVLYVLTRGDSLIIEAVSTNASFKIDELEGVYAIHTLVYDSTTLDLGDIVFGQTNAYELFRTLVPGGGSICAGLDTAGVRFRFGNCPISNECEADAGSLAAVEGACFQDSTATLTATIQDSAVVPDGFSRLYVLTSGSSLVIEQVNSQPTFTVDTIGTYRIHTLVYDSTTLNLNTIVFGQTQAGHVDSLLIQGGGTICGALDVTGALFEVDSCQVEGCNVDAGRIAANGSDATLTICLSDGEADNVQFSNTNAVLDSGTYAYVLTDTANIIVQVIAGNSENLDGLDSSKVYRIWGIVYSTDSLSLMAGDTLNLTTPVDSCSDVSDNFITIVNRCSPTEPVCEAATGRLSGSPIGCLQSGDTLMLSATVQTQPTVPSGYQVRYVLTSGSDLSIEQISETPSFEVDTTGTYRIHVLVYDSTTLHVDSLMTAGDVFAMLLDGGGEICAALDTAGVRFNVITCPSGDSCAVSFGSLVAQNENVCLSPDSAQVTLAANIQDAPIVLDSFQVAYLLSSGDSLTILDVSDTPSFTVDSVGRYTIHTLVYDSTTLSLDSLTTIANLDSMLIQGGGDICAALDVEGLVFNVEACSSDSCEFNLGTLTIDDASDDCLENGAASLIANVTTQPQVPNGYQVRYLLVYGLGDNRVIQQTSDEPSFTVDTTGRFRILTFVYDSTTYNLDSIVLGQTTSAELNTLLIQGGGSICAGLDVNGLIFNIDNCNQVNCDTDIDLGDLSRDTASVDCIGTQTPTGQLIGIVENEPSGPSGYQVTYLLAHGLGSNRVIEQINDQPTFTIDTAGRYRILTLVYDPATFNPDSIVLGQTSPFAIDSLFLQGGGSICAGFDVNGLVFTIEECNNPDSCSFDLGDIARDTASVDCIGDGEEGMLNATVVNEPVVPNGYQVRYLLAHGLGRNRVIEQINEAPSFTIDEPGRYRILTLVYDPATLDLNSIELGVTTPFDLDDRLVQGGGTICAGLDVNGLVYTIEACHGGGGNGECDSTDVGKLMIIGNDVRCFEGDSINVKLQFTHAPTVPSGYETAILVTLGDNMQVAKILAGLSFTVDSVALYRFQVLVYDPQTFNLSSINLGSTTAADINAQLVQGGGSICAALDTNGIVLDVRDCDVNVNCATDVKTGSLYAEADGACLDEDYQTTLTAQVDVPPMVPTGYQVKYLLTSGNDKVIRAFDDEPTFTVDQVDQFRIHVLVYDPATLDLGDIALNVTTIDSLNAMLIQGGGNICAALDVSGLRFYTRDCSCGADAGHLYYTRAGGRSLCLSESGLAFLAGNTQTRPVVPLGFNRVYLLTSGDGMVIEKIANIPVFGVRETGVYRLHTLIYDPNTLDLNSIQLGVTRATEIIQLLRQSGGDICAALEFPGLKFNVKDCSTEGGAPGIVAFPNPATNQVSINLPQQREVQQVTIEMVDINGNIAKRWQMDGVNTNVNLDINDLQPGMYYIRVLYDQEFVKELSLMKVR